MNKIASIAATLLLATPVFADGHEATGDAEAGEQQFGRQCVACHIVADADGEVLAGRNAQTGPNLFGIAGKQLGQMEDFRYSDAIVDLGEADTVWTEENFVAYVMDPTAWLREATDDNRARGKMAYRVRNEEDALNMYAYLAQFGPEEDAEEAESEG